MMTKKDFTKALSKKIALALSIGMFSISPFAQALPTGGTSETASIATADSTMNITSSQTNNIINWNTFSIANGETVNFDACNYLNLVNGSEASQIYGALNGQGMVFLINPNGILFGQGATINVAALTASTRTIDSVDQDAFMGLMAFHDYENPEWLVNNHYLNPDDVKSPEKIATAAVAARKGAIYGGSEDYIATRVYSNEKNDYVNETITINRKRVLPYPSEIFITNLGHTMTKSQETDYTFVDNMAGEIAIAALTNVNNASEIRLESGHVILQSADMLNNLTEVVTRSASTGYAIGGQYVTDSGTTATIFVSQATSTNPNTTYIHGLIIGGDSTNESVAIYDESGANPVRRINLHPSYVRGDETIPAVTESQIGWSADLNSSVKANMGKVITYPQYDSPRWEDVRQNVKCNYGEQVWKEIDQYSTYQLVTTPGALSALDGKGSYLLGSDIDMSSVQNFTPIGGDEYGNFNGSFNGLGYTIKNLNVNATDDYRVGGLFSSLGMKATVKNLNLENVNIQAAGSAGALAGYVGGATLDNINVKSGTVTSTNSDAGGIAGAYRGYSQTSQNVTTYPAKSSSLYNGATVTGAGDVGGIFGSLDQGTVSNAVNTGSVTGQSAGGIFGTLDTHATLSNAYNTGTVSSNTSYSSYTGGIIGKYNDSTSKMDNVFNLGAVKGQSTNVGGIAGGLTGNDTNTSGITNAYYAEGTVQDQNGNPVTNGVAIGTAEPGKNVATRIDNIWGTNLAAAYDTNTNTNTGDNTNTNTGDNTNTNTNTGDNTNTNTNTGDNTNDIEKVTGKLYSTYENNLTGINKTEPANDSAAPNPGRPAIDAPETSLPSGTDNIVENTSDQDLSSSNDDQEEEK